MTINDILTSINSLLDNKSNNNIIINDKNELQYTFTKSVRSNGDRKSTASVTISSKNIIAYNNFCTVNVFKENLKSYITNKITTKTLDDQLDKSIEILVYQLITQYIYQHSMIVIVPYKTIEDNKDVIYWYQRIALLNSSVSNNDANIKSDLETNIVELNILKNINYTGLLELFEKATLNKKISDLTIN